MDQESLGIDICDSCGAAWFDRGEIRELTEGRFPEDSGEFDEGENAPAFAFGNFGKADGKEENSTWMSGAHEKSASLACPKCSKPLFAIDFQNTGVPAFYCHGCEGTLVSGDGVRKLAARFSFYRKNAAIYNSVGGSLAKSAELRFNTKFGPKKYEPDVLESGKAVVSMIPIVVPLQNEARQFVSYPLVTYGILALIIITQLLYGLVERYQAYIALPSGVGFANAHSASILPSLFFHGGVVSFVICSLFLWVLGGDVEERMGHAQFLVFYIGCGLIAGAAHILWGTVGAPVALGSAGAIAGLLGAYIVFFPQTPITIYKAGEITTVPAYYLAGAWAVAQCILVLAPLPAFLNPAPYSIAGSLAGFAVGVGVAALQRSVESS